MALTAPGVAVDETDGVPVLPASVVILGVESTPELLSVDVATAAEAVLFESNKDDFVERAVCWFGIECGWAACRLWAWASWGILPIAVPFASGDSWRVAFWNSDNMGPRSNSGRLSKILSNAWVAQEFCTVCRAKNSSFASDSKVSGFRSASELRSVKEWLCPKDPDEDRNRPLTPSFCKRPVSLLAVPPEQLPVGPEAPVFRTTEFEFAETRPLRLWP